MNDNDIIKALNDELKTALTVNHRFMETCDTENPDDDRFITLLSCTINLINRLKAENERLTKDNEQVIKNWHILDKQTKERYAALYEQAKGVVKADAIKEFAAMLKTHLIYPRFPWEEFYINESYIDYLVKEMTEDQK